MKTTLRWLLVCVFAFSLSAAHAQDKPNIVLVYMDNFGWGEPGFNGGGVIRGAATPRLDELEMTSNGRRLPWLRRPTTCFERCWRCYRPARFGGIR